jgi:hypothetical protein
MRYLPESIVADEHGSHSNELCDEEPVVALHRLLKAVLLVVGQPDLAPWSHRSSTARFFLLGFDGLRRRLNPPARMTARPTTSMCLATDSPLPPPVSASTHESPRCSSRTTDIVWPNTLSLPDFCRVYYDPEWYNGPRCSGQNTPIR